jgi:hypothetical protein
MWIYGNSNDIFTVKWAKWHVPELKALPGMKETGYLEH